MKTKLSHAANGQILWVILEEKSEQKINTEKYAQPQQLGKCKLKPQKVQQKSHAAGLGWQESDHTSLYQRIGTCCLVGVAGNW